MERRKEKITVSAEKVIKSFMQIGGENGWYYWDWLWTFRGAIDKLVGGIGCRRRVARKELRTGDALDFWRILAVESERLLLYAEMKMPGEAWLEFKIEEDFLVVTATFRPKGLLGRLYWIVLFPIHYFLFTGLVHSIVKKAKSL